MTLSKSSCHLHLSVPLSCRDLSPIRPCSAAPTASSRREEGSERGVDMAGAPGLKCHFLRLLGGGCAWALCCTSMGLICEMGRAPSSTHRVVQ